MKRLNCFTPFLDTGKKFKLESGETYDDFVNKSTKLAYTIYIDSAILDWAWVKPANDMTTYVGSCISDGTQWFGEHDLSDEFIGMVEQWLNSYKPVSKVAHDKNALDVLDFDWEAFNRHGFEIAKKLKSELGDSAVVRYVKSGEDPTRRIDEGYEVLDDGSVMLIERLLPSK